MKVRLSADAVRIFSLLDVKTFFCDLLAAPPTNDFAGSVGRQRRFKFWCRQLLMGSCQQLMAVVEEAFLLVFCIGMLMAIGKKESNLNSCCRQYYNIKPLIDTVP